MKYEAEKRQNTYIKLDKNYNHIFIVRHNLDGKETGNMKDLQKSFNRSKNLHNFNC